MGVRFCRRGSAGLRRKSGCETHERRRVRREAVSDYARARRRRHAGAVRLRRGRHAAFFRNSARAGGDPAAGSRDRRRLAGISGWLPALRHVHWLGRGRARAAHGAGADPDGVPEAARQVHAPHCRPRCAGRGLELGAPARAGQQLEVAVEAFRFLRPERRWGSDDDRRPGPRRRRSVGGLRLHVRHRRGLGRRLRSSRRTEGLRQESLHKLLGAGPAARGHRRLRGLGGRGCLDAYAGRRLPALRGALHDRRGRARRAQDRPAVVFPHRRGEGHALGQCDESVLLRPGRARECRNGGHVLE